MKEEKTVLFQRMTMVNKCQIQIPWWTLSKEMQCYSQTESTLIFMIMIY